MNRRINDITVLNNEGGTEYLTFEPLMKLEWLNHAFSTRKGGCSKGPLESLNLGYERGDDIINVDKNWRLFSGAAGFDVNKIAFPNQWHTNNIRIADESSWAMGVHPDKDSKAIDGQITNVPGTVLVTYGADCTPIYLADRTNHVIGLCHSGWKGTLNSIVCDTIRLMNETYGTEPENLVAVIGPSISCDAYEVSEDVASKFIEKHGISVSENSKIVKTGKRKDKYQLDLWEANKANLLEAGVHDEDIFVSGICTYTDDEHMYSHRRDGNARGVMAAFMSINE